jgi:hypothetical protein
MISIPSRNALDLASESVHLEKSEDAYKQQDIFQQSIFSASSAFNLDQGCSVFSEDSILKR